MVDLDVGGRVRKLQVFCFFGWWFWQDVYAGLGSSVMFFVLWVVKIMIFLCGSESELLVVISIGFLLSFVFSVSYVVDSYWDFRFWELTGLLKSFGTGW